MRNNSGASDIDLSYAITLPPEKAIAYFRRKGRRISFDWHSMWAEAHATAFTVANCSKLDVLRDIQIGIRKALREGKTERWFVDTLEPVLRKKGWWGPREEVNPETGEVIRISRGSPSRLRLIYRQNMQSAYNAGRYRQQIENRDNQPYLRYLAILDMRTRAAHAAMHNRIFRVDDPIWQVWYPPNDWGCRCRVEGVSGERVARQGWEVEKSGNRIVTREIEVRDRRTGEITRRTITGYEYEKGRVAWVGAGFDYNAGAVAMADNILHEHVEKLRDPRLYEQARQAINNSAARHEGFAATVRVWLGDKLKRGRQAVMGIMGWRELEYVRGAGKDASGVVLFGDAGLTHSDRAEHHRGGIAVREDTYPELARMFANPEAVYWDKTKEGLIYVFPDTDPEWCIMMPLQTPAGNRKARRNLGPHDALATLYRARRGDLKKHVRIK